MRRAILVCLASLAVLASTATGARLLTGADVRDASLTSAEFPAASLGARDLEPGALRGPRGRRGPPGRVGPLGPSTHGDPGPFTYYRLDATIAPDGTVVAGSLAGATVTHPSTGVYCLQGLSASVVQVTSTDAADPRIVAAAPIPRSGSTPCDQQAGGHRIAVFTDAGVPADGGTRVIAS